MSTVTLPPSVTVVVPSSDDDDDDEIVNKSIHTEMTIHKMNHQEEINNYQARRRRPTPTLTDEQLLMLAFGSFLSFAILQLTVAVFLAHSHAMMGDSACMLIDALTYGLNGYSERRKQQLYHHQRYDDYSNTDNDDDDDGERHLYNPTSEPTPSPPRPQQQQQQAPEVKPSFVHDNLTNEGSNSHHTTTASVDDDDDDDNDDDENSGTASSRHYIQMDHHHQHHPKKHHRHRHNKHRQHHHMEPPLPPILATAEATIEFWQYRQQVLILEWIAPSISITALLGVTIYIAQQAIRTIQSIVSPTRFSSGAATAEEEEPNLLLILSFSLFNLLLDSVNMYCFTRPQKHACGAAWDHYNDDDDEDDETHTDPEDLTDTNHQEDDEDNVMTTTTATTISQSPMMTTTTTTNKHQPPAIERPDALVPRPPLTTVPPPPPFHHTNQQRYHHHSHSSTITTTYTTNSNMNMCSAYSHVMADTMRSLAVITAVVLALVKGIEPALADAVAALIVSFLIVLSVIPLFQGLYRTSCELYQIRLLLQQHAQEQIHFQKTTSISCIGLAESNHKNSSIV